MEKGPVYYSEAELAEKHQSGEYTWKDYISHHSEEWCDEYEAFCKEHDYDENDDMVARMFVEYKDRQLEDAIENGEA